MQDALAGGLFEPQQTPEQQVALRRLETLLALVEGWVDTVVAAAAGDRMPGAEALREASRRRRATGGPAEQTFATLVGLELRPRRLREAAALWWGVTEKRGISGRDAIWVAPGPAADRRRPRRPARLRRHAGPDRRPTSPPPDDRPSERTTRAEPDATSPARAEHVDGRRIRGESVSPVDGVGIVRLEIAGQVVRDRQVAAALTPSR